MQETKEKFSILQYEGNQSGFTVEIFVGTEWDAKLRAKELTEKLTEDQRKAGWGHEVVRSEGPKQVQRLPSGLKRRAKYSR